MKSASLNHTFRLVWSTVKQMYVAVAEICRGRGKRKNSIAAAAASVMLVTGGAAHALDPDALPAGAEISHGEAEIERSDNVMNIHQSSDKLITNWENFDIGRDAAVNFDQPDSDSAALNRVTGNNPSQIHGNLNANGEVYLVNPSGILFGESAQVDVGGLVASTLEIADQDFIDGNLDFKNLGFSDGEIENLGHIRANGGVVALISNRVSNQGMIEANNGEVAVAAGDRVTLDFTGDGLMTVQVEQGVLDALAENGGLIQADGGYVIMTTQAQNDIYRSVVNNDGIVEARTLEADSSGRIMLMGGMSEGQVNASGTLDASAPETGDGGFIETSAANVQIRPDLKVTTHAETGQVGEWVIDPVDITAAASGGNVTGATLAAALEDTDVTLDTAGSGACTGVACTSFTGNSGDIFIEDDIVVSGGSTDTTLTLLANRNIDIAAGTKISRGGDYGLNLDFKADSDGNETGDIVLNGITTLNVNNGDVTFDAHGVIVSHNVDVQGDLLVDAPITLQNGSDVAFTSTTGSIGFLDTVDGDADLTLDIEAPMDGAEGLGVVNAEVGSSAALNTLTTQGDGTIFINANVTTTGAQTYNNDLYIGSGPLAQFVNNNFESSDIGDGATMSDVAAFDQSEIDSNNVYEDRIEGWTLYLNRAVSGTTAVEGSPMPAIDNSDLRLYIKEGSKSATLFLSQGERITDLPSGCDQPDSCELLKNNPPLGSSVFGPAYVKVVDQDSTSGNGQSIELNIDNAWFPNAYQNTGSGRGIIRGPFVVSDSTAALSAGDSVSFDWKATGNKDDFAVYAYLLDPKTGQTVELLNAIGGKTDEATTQTIDSYNTFTGDARGPGDWSDAGNNNGWISSSVSLPDDVDTGDYHFVFVSGTWDGDGGGQTGASMGVDNIQTSNTAVQALFDTQDPLPGEVVLRSDTDVDIKQPNVVTLQKDLRVEVPDGDTSADLVDISADLDGPGAIELESANVALSGKNTHAETIITGGDLTLEYDEVPAEQPRLSGTGAISIVPEEGSGDFSGTVDLSAWDFDSVDNGITVGEASTADGSGDQDVVLGDVDADGPLSVFGKDVTITGHVDSGGNATALNTTALNSSGQIADTGVGRITADQLLLSSGAISLDSADNDVGTIAASGVSSVTFRNQDELTVGSFDGTVGIDATGPISVSTESGDLNVDADVTTTDTSDSAVILNSGSGRSVGDPAGGDIVLAGSAGLTAGQDGQILLYTGSVDGSTGVTSLVGSGSGNFRYNSDESSSNFTSSLDPTEVNAVYREQPTVDLSLSQQTITYGDAIPYADIANVDQGAIVNGDKGIDIGNRRASNAGLLQANTAGYLVTSNLKALGYKNTGDTSTRLEVDPLPLAVTNASAADKGYDGTTRAEVSGGSIATENGDLVSLSEANASFVSGDAGDDIDVDTDYTISGEDAGNYSLSQPTGLEADITKAPLDVIANDDAKFVTQDDNVSGDYAGVSYEGFVNGETESDLGGTPDITRSNGEIDDADVYTGVLKASGLTSNNYNITFVDGDYTIVPADQLLVRVDDVSNEYGTDTTYHIASAKYLKNDNTIADLTNYINKSGNDIDVVDGASAEASFTVAPLSPSESSAGLLEVGSYQLGAENISKESGVNFSNTITVVGAHQVNKKELTASADAGVSKTYDGTTNMEGVSLNLNGVEGSGGNADAVTVDGAGVFSQSDAGDNLEYTISNLTLSGADSANYRLQGGDSFSKTNGEILKRNIALNFTGADKIYDGDSDAAVDITDNRIAGDVLTFTEGEAFTAAFTDKNVGTDKTINISGIALGGADSGNYNEPLPTGTTSADITRLDSVTWTGGSTGDWFDRANWAGGAVPDLSNVANVDIPSGVTVTFDNTTSGPAISANDEENAVQIDSLGNSGNLQHDEGFLNVGTGGVTLGGYDQSGGELTNTGATTVDRFDQSGGSFDGSGDFTVNEDFDQTGSGTVIVGGNTDITDIGGGMSVGNLDTTGTLNLRSTDGAIHQASDTTVAITGGATLTASDRNDPATAYDITLADAGNEFGDTVTADGDDVEIAATGALNADVTAATDATLNAMGDLDAAIVAGTNATLDADGQTTFGPTIVGGDLTSTTGGDGEDGGVSQTGDVTVEGDASFIANTGTTQDAGLANAANDFQGSVSFTNANNGTWNDVTLQDGVGGLTLGEIDAGGDLDLTSAGATSLGKTTASGDLDLTSDGSITQTDELDIAGTAGLTSTNGDITLADVDNDFGGTVTATGAAVTLNDSDDLEAALTTSGPTDLTAVGDITASGEVAGASGDLTLDADGQTIFGETIIDGDLTSTTRGESGDGGVSQTGDVTVEGDASFIANTGTTQDAGLANAANDFQGSVSFTNANNGTWNDVTLQDGVGGLALGEIDAGGDLGVTSTDGAIDQASDTTVAITGGATLTASDGNDPATAYDITLADAVNEFGDTVTADGDDVEIASTGALDADVTAATDATLNATGDLNAAVVAGNNATLDAGGQTTFGPTTVGGDLTSTTGGVGENGGVSQSGDVTVEGDASFIADTGTTQDAGLANAANDFKGAVSFTDESGGSWNAVSVTDENALELGDVTASSLQAESGAELSNAENASIAVKGNADLSGASVDLGSESGDSVNAGSLTFDSSGSVGIAEDSATELVGTNTADSLTLSSSDAITNAENASIAVTGNADLSGASIDLGSESGDSVNAGSLTFDSSGSVGIAEDSATELVGTNTADSLTLSSSGEITDADGATLAVDNKTTLTARNGDDVDQAITLDNAGNDFGGLATVSGAAVTLNDVDDLTADLTTSGPTNLTAADDVTVSGTVTGASGDLTLDAGGQTTFGTTTVGGDLTSTTRGESGDGGVSQTGDLTVEGDASFIADSGTTQDAGLTDSANDFQGSVSFTNAEGGDWNDVTLEDGVDGLTLGEIDAGGKLDATAKDDLSLNGEISADSLDLESTVGGIAQTDGSLTVERGLSDLTASGDITLADVDNKFAGKVTADGDNVVIDATDELDADVTAGADATLDASGDLVADLDVTGDSTLDSGDDMTVSGNSKDLRITSGGTTSLGQTTATGNLDLTSDGSITQTDELDIAGTTDLTSTDGDIALDDEENAFGERVTADGGAVEIASAGGLDADVKASDDITLDADGTVTAELDAAGDSTLTSVDQMAVSGGSENLTITATGEESAATFGPTDVGGDLSVTTNNGDVTQSGPITVQDTTTIVAGDGEITLNNADNDFAGAVSASADRLDLAGNRTAIANLRAPNKSVEDTEKANQNSLEAAPTATSPDDGTADGDQLVAGGTDSRFVELGDVQLSDTGDSRSLATGESEARALSAGLPIFSADSADTRLISVVEVQDRGSSISASPSSADTTNIATPNITNSVATQKVVTNTASVTGIDASVTIRITEDQDLLIEVPRALATTDDQDVILTGVLAAKRIGVTVDQLRSIVLVRD